MLLDALVKKTTLSLGERQILGLSGNLVPQLLDQADLLAQGQFAEGLDYESDLIGYRN